MRELMSVFKFVVAAACLTGGAPAAQPSETGQADSDLTEKSSQEKGFRAGAYAIDITPRKFPVIVNGSFQERAADRAHDPLHARCLVLDDGATRVAIVVVDSCLMPRELLDEAKKLAHDATGIPTDGMLISATHTHSAPSVMGALGSDADREYIRFLPARIAEGIHLALKNLAPARLGWAVVKDSEHTHCRRWILRPDKVRTDPFGQPTVRAMMHPGYQNPDFLGPAGPVDADVSMLSVQSPDGKPIALLANYSMHYYGSAALSADYYGRFATKFTKLIEAEEAVPPFVAILSQGTSGDLHWMDYSQPPRQQDMDSFAEAIARVAHEAYRKIQYRDRVPVRMGERKLELGIRLPDAERLAWARRVLAEMKGQKPRTLPEIYAREQVLLAERPTRQLKLQALCIGDLGIAAIPCEVFGITGLKIKGRSPLVPTFVMELANGAEGYIPPPEQHKLGGYTTWEARSAGLEVNAEPKIVEAVLGLLEDVSGRRRRPVVETPAPYAEAVLDSKPVVYWRLGEFNGPLAIDATGKKNDGEYEDGVAFYLEGPALDKGSSDRKINRAPHFAGGRMKAEVGGVGSTYSAEMWFCNALPNDARAVTGYLFSRGVDGADGAPGDHLGIGGTHTAMGKLLFFNGNDLNQVLCGTTEVRPGTWNHVVLVRDGENVTVYLNGKSSPEIRGRAAIGYSSEVKQVFIGGRNDNFANFEGRIDEVAMYDRALSPDDVAKHYNAAATNSDLSFDRRKPGDNRVSETEPFDESKITGTFSIVAVDPEKGECGAAVASKYPAVGKIVPYVRGGVGAFCTQHCHNPEWGERALDLLEAGKATEEVLAELLRDDPRREQRQLAIIDMSGRVANHNPSQAQKGSLYWAAMSGRYYSCQGNTLVGREVIVAMSQAYEETEGSLADRLMAALMAGDRAGGDHRGRLAAGLRVAKRGVEGYWLELYVDKSEDAVIDLGKKYADLEHEAKGLWRGGNLPFEHPRPKTSESESEP